MFLKFLKYPIKVKSKSIANYQKDNIEMVEQVEIYPESKIFYAQPKTIEKNNVFSQREVIVPQLNVNIIKKGKCYTRNGLVLTSDNVLIKDCTPVFPHPLANKRHYKFQKCETILGSVAVLTNDSCQKNYYHWLIENASRLHLIDKSGVEIDKYIINNECSYQKRILDCLGVPLKKLSLLIQIDLFKLIIWLFQV